MHRVKSEGGTIIDVIMATYSATPNANMPMLAKTARSGRATGRIRKPDALPRRMFLRNAFPGLKILFSCISLIRYGCIQPLFHAVCTGIGMRRGENNPHKTGDMSVIINTCPLIHAAGPDGTRRTKNPTGTKKLVNIEAHAWRKRKIAIFFTMTMLSNVFLFSGSNCCVPLYLFFTIKYLDNLCVEKTVLSSLFLFSF